ncbi:sensor histidine kinase [Salinimonas lutimaris]|uniref:sensor histidine kinase n=1 Tax=Salinimonas lutimaris TaxID=914153 RepID=UPI0010BFC0F1|nr:ATP-binding protein [Salinimonas lutimaris]
MRLSFQWKVIVVVALIQTLVLAGGLAIFASYQQEWSSRQLTLEARHIASTFARDNSLQLMQKNISELAEHAQDYMSTFELAQFTVLDNKGMALLNQQAANIAPGQREVLNVPYSTADGIAGSITIGLSRAAFDSYFEQLMVLAIGAGFVQVFLVSLATRYLSHVINRKLTILREGARDIRQSVEQRVPPKTRIPLTGKGELAQLALAFNELSDALQATSDSRYQAQLDLEALNKNLESEVMKRTSLLQHKTRLLEAANRELKETQAQLLQAEKMASVGQLAAGVAHEINNPVGFVGSNISTLADYIAAYQRIIGLLSQALDNDAPTPAQWQQLQHIFDELDIAFINEDIGPLIEESGEGLERVGEIVRGLKLFSRVDSDERQAVSVNDVIRTTLSMVNNQLKYICTVELKLSDIPPVTINVGKITQVLTNLFINAGQAIEATEKQGMVTITTAVEEDMLSIRVTDTGHGIKQEHLDKLFNPFFTTKPEGKGTGLGLSISYTIIEEHGGTISAESQEGKGSEFIVRLPLVTSNEKETEDSLA